MQLPLTFTTWQRCVSYEKRWESNDSELCQMNGWRARVQQLSTFQGFFVRAVLTSQLFSDVHSWQKSSSLNECDKEICFSSKECYEKSVTDTTTHFTAKCRWNFSWTCHEVEKKQKCVHTQQNSNVKLVCRSESLLGFFWHKYFYLPVVYFMSARLVGVSGMSTSLHDSRWWRPFRHTHKAAPSSAEPQGFHISFLIISSAGKKDYHW